MTKVTASFESQKVSVGIDIHKRSWNAGVYLNEQFIRNIHQPPSPQALHHYLEQNYPRQIMFVLMSAASLVTGCSGSSNNWA